MSSDRRPITKLEIDESIISSQLKINKDEEDELQQLINTAMSEREKERQQDSLPYKAVIPTPGFCVKTKNLVNNQKVFVNVCHTAVIPAPVDITDSELTRILESDEPSSFRIPMSLGEGHQEVDKSGHACIAYDVAINSKFFAKLEGSLLFQTFLITIAMEGLEDKYKMELDKNGWNMLKNRKCFGTMQVHCIEQRHEKPFVQEVPKSSIISGGGQTPKLIEEVEEDDRADPDMQAVLREAKYSLVSTREGIKLIVARVPVQDPIEKISLSIVDKDSLSVVGSDGKPIVNVTFPQTVDPEKGKSIFNKATKIMTILLPVM